MPGQLPRTYWFRSSRLPGLPSARCASDWTYLVNSNSKGASGPLYRWIWIPPKALAVSTAASRRRAIPLAQKGRPAILLSSVRGAGLPPNGQGDCPPTDRGGQRIHNLLAQRCCPWGRITRARSDSGFPTTRMPGRISATRLDIPTNCPPRYSAAGPAQVFGVENGGQTAARQLGPPNLWSVVLTPSRVRSKDPRDLTQVQQTLAALGTVSETEGVDDGGFQSSE